MGDKTKIQWTESTWNPVRGCSIVSPGCHNCYAMGVAARFSEKGLPYEGLARRSSKGLPQWTGKVRLVPEHLADPLRWTKPRRVFVNSMSDLFHEGLSNEDIAAVFGVMAAARRHTFQVLTKRAKRMREWFEVPGIHERVETFMHVAVAGRIEEYFAPERVEPIKDWPGYFVTSKGRVLSDNKGPRREMKPMRGEQGHSRVMLYRHSDINWVEFPHEDTARPLIHRLVLEAFDRPALSDKEQACHIDGDATNNALWNLRWGSQSDNWQDRKRHGNGRSYSKLLPESVQAIRNQAEAGYSYESLGRLFGVSATQIRNIVENKQWTTVSRMPWPLPSVWLGVSAEDQQRADERIPDLLATPAAVRFVSYEPALGPIDFGVINTDDSTIDALWDDEGTTLDWVIVGGESGPRARPFDVAWARSVVKRCADAKVACFVKQIGRRVIGDPREFPFVVSRVVFVDGSEYVPPVLAYVEWLERHSNLFAGFVSVGKGDDLSEWPEDLRVRQYPAASL